MTLLKGIGQGVDFRVFQRASEALTAEYEAQEAVFKALHSRVEPPPAGAIPTMQSKGAQILAQEAKNPRSRIDWDRLAALRKATPEQLREAMEQFRAIDHIDLHFAEIVRGMHYLGNGLELEKLPDHDVRMHYERRKRMLDSMELIKNGILSAGDCPALENFPAEQFDLLEKNVRDDIDAIVGKKPMVAKPAFDMRTVGPSSYGGGYGGYSTSYSWKPIAVDPNPEMLPETKSLQANQVATIEDAAKAIAQRVSFAGLEEQLLAVAKDVPEDRKDELTYLLGAYALLVDEAVHAPDFRAYSVGSKVNRQAYRARETGWGDEKVNGERRNMSRERLTGPLVELANAEDAVAALATALVNEFVREIGLPIDLVRDWDPKPQAVREALENEALIPLRAINERATAMMGPRAFEMAQVARQISQAVVEGRFEEWIGNNPASQRQLECLTEEQKKVWLGNLSVEHETKALDGTPVTLKTIEARGFDRFWATKVGGASYGFDTMSPCVIPFVTNGRNSNILVEDPRWPTPAGRTNFRMVQLAKTGEPVLFMESSWRDQPYPASHRELEAAMAKHAIAKGKEMGVQVVLSGRCHETIKHLGLKGDWREEKYLLAPALYYEAASVFGNHDWVQLTPEVRGATSIQFLST
jgi:hypothetical protein